MNCQPGDIAFVRTICPRTDLHGRLVECIEFVGAMQGHSDVWRVRSVGGPIALDDGRLQMEGGMSDSHLKPLRGGPIIDSAFNARHLPGRTTA